MNIATQYNPTTSSQHTQAASNSSPLLRRKSHLTRPVTRLCDITWDLVVARRREAQARNQFLQTVLRLAQDDRR